MRIIKNIKFWKQQLGLYPILIDPMVNSKYILLNGGDKDFCLQTTNFKNHKDSFFSDSWSTNTKNFVVFDTNYAYVYTWYDNKIQKYPLKDIEENTDRFYTYLSLKSYKTPSDVVPFIINIFRQLRNLTGKKEPEEALTLLFKLLISIDDDYSKINSLEWGISDVKVPSKFDYYVELIKQGVCNISPNRDLILRHAAGTLFQEAHKEVVYFDHQMDLWGGYSDKLVAKSEPYSSVHYTPTYLARSIVENCLKQLEISNKQTLKIFDPACGSSEFLIETLKQLKNANYQGKVKIIGWDSLPSSICASKFLLKYEQRTQWGNKSLEFEIKRVMDSLTERWDNDYDLIVMNPPFVSWELLKDKNRKTSILETLGSVFNKGKPNQASAFFYKAAKSLKPNGVIGCVLPSSIFTADSYCQLRNEIQEEFTINILAKLGNFVFESALTDVSFFIAKKGRFIVPAKLIWTKNEKGISQEVLLNLRKMELNNQPAVEKSNYSIYSTPKFPLNMDSWKIISLKSNKFKQDVERFVREKKLFTINEVFTIKCGASSGLKNIFKIPNDHYGKLSKNEQKFFRPVITNQSIKSGQLEISQFIWFPYDKNGMIIKNETELESISFAKEILIPNREMLIQRRGIKEWWGLSRPRNWQFEKNIRLYSSRFGNSNSFTIDTNGNCVIEEGNAFIPNKKIGTDDYYFYLSVFSSDIFDMLLSIYSKQLAGGDWYDLGARYTKNIPIPNAHLSEVKESDQYIRLVELGRELKNGTPYLKHAINDVLKIYYPIISK